MYQSIISMNTMLEAIKFYEKHGFKLIDVPMCVDIDCSSATKPTGACELHHFSDAVYVASAEQSFIQMHKDGLIGDGKYMAVTPCYRSENQLDFTHYSIFLKLELIVIGEVDSIDVSYIAAQFFAGYSQKEVVLTNTQEGIMTYDIEIDGIEVGSYGIREMLDGTVYTYGTGLAEPRFTYAINK